MGAPSVRGGKWPDEVRYTNDYAWGDDVPADRTPLYAFEPDMKYLAQGYNDTVEALLRIPSAPLKRVQMYVGLGLYENVQPGEGYDLANTLRDGDDGIFVTKSFLNDLSLGEFQQEMTILTTNLHSQMGFDNVDRFSPGLVRVTYVGYALPPAVHARSPSGAAVVRDTRKGCLASRLR